MSRSVPRRGLSAPATITIAVVICVMVLTGAILYDAWAKTREKVPLVRSQWKLNQIVAAMFAAADDGLELTPANLVSKGYIAADVFDSPFGPAPDGRGDFWVLAERPALDDPSDEERCIVAFDRAMYPANRLITIAFLDGHITSIRIAEFNQLISSPPNDGRDFDLPARTRR